MDTNLIDINVEITEVTFDVEIIGSLGEPDHALLNHLDYSNSGHTNFQKKLLYIPEFRAFEID